MHAHLNTLPLASTKTMNRSTIGLALLRLTVEKSRCRAAGGGRGRQLWPCLLQSLLGQHQCKRQAGNSGNTVKLQLVRRVPAPQRHLLSQASSLHQPSASPIRAMTHEWCRCPAAMISSRQWTYSCGRRRASSAMPSATTAYDEPRTSGAVWAGGGRGRELG